MTWLSVSASPAADDVPRQRVLILYDENGDYSGLANLDQSLKASLAGGIAGGVEVYTEFMDVSRLRDPEHETRLRDAYRLKYATRRFDLMIGVMAPSLNFLLRYGEDISPGTPIVFCGIDGRELAGRALPPNLTGVLVERKFKPTLDIALRLHPGTRQVFFVAGTSPFNRYWTQQAKGELAEFEQRVKITYLTDLPMESLEADVSRLPRDSIVLFLHLFRDGAGRTFNPNDSAARVARSANVPVYVFFDQYVGGGTVGGYVYSVEAHGARAAQLAGRILNGEKPSDIPVAEAGASSYLFDARQLRRWKVSNKQLPAGATVRFREATFWERYRRHLLVAVAIIVAQSVLIFALLVQRRQRHLAEAARKKARDEVAQKRLELEHVARVATLGELTTTLTHELKQPLNAIRVNSALGLSLVDSPEPDLAELRATLCDIAQVTDRVGEMIRGMRDFLRRDTPGVADVDINQVIRNVARIAHSDAIQHQVDVRLELSPGAFPVRGDSVQLQQVVLNLMLNAFSAMGKPSPDGDGDGDGQPRIDAARRLVVRTKSIDGSSVLVELQDGGTGIAPDKIASIFEPFVTTKPEGLGMGLPISRSIIERHRGWLWAKNNPDRGATFSIMLPVCESGRGPPRGTPS